MYLRRTTSGTAGSGLNKTAKYVRGAAGIGLGTMIKDLRRTTSGGTSSPETKWPRPIQLEIKLELGFQTINMTK
jgi:hypothetical protein